MTHPELQALVAKAIYAPLLQSGQRLEFYHKMKADAAIEAVIEWLVTRSYSEEGILDEILADMEGREG